MDSLSKDKQIGLWFQEIGVDEVIDHQPTNKMQAEVLTNKAKDQVIKKFKSNILLNSLTASRKIADSCDNLEDLFKAINEFNECSLKATANNTVVGEGNINSEIIVMGEAPGAQEDLEGRPFCGASGKLLDLMLNSIGLSREKNIFITNTVFWRPPANRKPTNEELTMCLPFIERLISFIKPKLIIMVGSVSASNLTGQNIAMSELRKKPHHYDNNYLEAAIECFAIFHPAFLLRQPSQKKATWFDLLNIKQFIETNKINN